MIQKDTKILIFYISNILLIYSVLSTDSLVDMGIIPIFLHKTVRALLTHTAFHSIFGTLSVKQTHFNTWFKQWKCPEQSIKESIQSITSSLASPIEPLKQ